MLNDAALAAVLAETGEPEVGDVENDDELLVSLRISRFLSVATIPIIKFSPFGKYAYKNAFHLILVYATHLLSTK